MPRVKRFIGTLLQQLIQECRAQMYSIEHLDRVQAGNGEGVEQRVLKDLKRTRLSCSHMIRLLAHPLRPPPPPVSMLSLFLSLPCMSPFELTDGGRERGGVGAKSYDGEKTWSLIHHSILSGIEGGRAVVYL